MSISMYTEKPYKKLIIPTIEDSHEVVASPNVQQSTQLTKSPPL